MNDKNAINIFIERVFNYLNGRVNIFNRPAVLEIDWTPCFDSSVGAAARNPNRVIIFPEVIKRFFPNEYDFYYNIIISLIHELHHVDQVIDYIEMTKNPNYLNDIEYCVEFNSYMYMANNQIAIEQAIGFRDIHEFTEYMPNITKYEVGHIFHRRDYPTHIISMMQDMVRQHRCQFYDDIMSTFMIPDSIISLIINDKMLDIKIGLECCPLTLLNNILEEEYYKYNYRRASVKYNLVTNPVQKMVIKIDCCGKNILGYKKGE